MSRRGAVLVVRSSPGGLVADVERALQFALREGLAPHRQTFVKINGNFNVEYPGSNTSSWFLDALLGGLRRRGFERLTVVEGDLPEFRATDMIRGTGLERVLARHSVDFLPLEGLELEADRLPRILSGPQLVNVPVMHTHGQAVISCATKNLFGLLPRDRRRYHGALSEKLLELRSAVPSFTIVDGTVGLDGESTRRGNPVLCDLILAGRDTLDVDWVAAGIMGFDPLEIPVLALAHRRCLTSAPEPLIEGDFDHSALPRYRFDLEISLVRRLANFMAHTPLVELEPLWRAADVLRVGLHRINRRVKERRLREGPWSEYQRAYASRVRAGVA